MSGRSGRGAEADRLCQLPGSETLPDVTKTLHKLGFLTVGTKLGVLGCCRVKVTHTHYPIVGKDLQNVHLCGENAAIAITDSIKRKRRVLESLTVSHQSLHMLSVQEVARTLATAPLGMYFDVFLHDTAVTLRGCAT